ncbi:MAG: GatB/YqeY domain-containing protein [Bacteroidetes bacterium]|nr:GatB/YqeY domain-containing protein [Bacteroidota bacterium]
MSTFQQILSDLKEAMKSRDSDKATVLRSLKTNLQEKEISMRSGSGAVELKEDEVIQVLMKAAKQRKDSLDQFEKASREDLASVERYELEIIEAYLPKMMGEDEIRSLVQSTAIKVGASAPADMGKLMGALMPQVKGKADGALVNKIVKEHLAG